MYAFIIYELKINHTYSDIQVQNQQGLLIFFQLSLAVLLYLILLTRKNY